MRGTVSDQVWRSDQVSRRAIPPSRLVLTCAAIVALLAAAAGASAQQPSGTGAAAGRAAEVLELERRIEAAVLRADIAFLDGVLASDFTYTHGDGWTTGGAVRGVDHRAEWLASLPGRYNRREVDSQQVELHGDVAITMGRVRAGTGPSAGAPRAFSFWYVRVYALRDGRWQYLSHRTVHGPVYEGDAGATATPVR